MEKSFFEKDQYLIGDLEDLIKNEIEESLFLDYKASGALSKEDKKKSEIAKDVSAFANSDGGFIIYGINEENHKPTSFSFIDGNIYNKEWLENIIDGNIQQRIQGLEIHPIRVDGLLEKTIYIIKIPASLNAPHMCTDKKYYRRYNFKSVVMEEYEVRNLYNRVLLAEIDVKRVMTKALDDEYVEGIWKVKKEFFVQVENISRSLEKHCKLEAIFLNIGNLDAGISYYKDSNVRQKISPEKGLIITSYNETPIFPGEEYQMLRFELSLNKDHLEEFKQNVKLKLTLFDSSSTKTYEYELKKLMGIITENDV